MVRHEAPELRQDYVKPFGERPIGAFRGAPLQQQGAGSHSSPSYSSSASRMRPE